LTTIGSVRVFELRHGVPELLGECRDLRKEPMVQSFDHVPVSGEAFDRGFCRGPAPLGLPCAPPAELAGIEMPPLRRRPQRPACWEAHPALGLIGLDRDPAALAGRCDRLAPFAKSAAAGASNFAAFTKPPWPVRGVPGRPGVEQSAAGFQAQRGFSFRARWPPRHAHGSPRAGKRPPELIDRSSSETRAGPI